MDRLDEEVEGGIKRIPAPYEGYQTYQDPYKYYGDNRQNPEYEVGYTNNLRNYQMKPVQDNGLYNEPWWNHINTHQSFPNEQIALPMRRRGIRPIKDNTLPEWRQGFMRDSERAGWKGPPEYAYVQGRRKFPSMGTKRMDYDRHHRRRGKNVRWEDQINSQPWW
jgi:hypothetical protein